MAAKLGLTHFNDNNNRLFNLLSSSEIDMTLFFELADVRQDDTDLMQPLTEAYYNSADTQGKQQLPRTSGLKTICTRLSNRTAVMKNVDV